ncbi:general secretion pathway protein D [Sulfuricella denitrificans skB26]|uniref:General secretion pathway protein D n=2 Tax=Sulfuricella denitrificans TaxID=649841 RepID=S6A9N5_SULDS|nr:general secretion pathway protein D [Sulfuricella denitrificans skB26]
MIVKTQSGNLSRMKNTLIAFTGSLLLAACGTQPITPSAGHIKDEPRAAGNIPKPVQQAAPLPPPKPATKAETYSVVVNNVPVQELLFALARDARVNVDVHPGIEGSVTLNALNQTLPQLLTRIAKQVDMRYELDGPNLVVMPDSPFLRNYKVDYLNMSRDATSNVSIATQISTTGTGAGGTSSGTGNNNSTTSVTNKSNNRFWETLVQNIKDILRETDKVLPEGSSETTTEQAGNQSTSGTGAAATARQSGSRTNAAPTNLAGSPNPATLLTDNTTVTRRTTFREAASVIANPENGLLSVRATGRQHEKIREFIDQVMTSARRQVLIEATVVEVKLSDQYQQGINWSSLRNDSTGFNLTQGRIGTLPSGVNPGVSPGIFTLGYANPNSVIGNIAATIQLLESFGNVKVLSSPKISVLNNQTALLKVVDNKIYFTISVTPATYSLGVLTAPAVYTSTVNTVPVGFVMSVTPQIDDTDTVTLNVRPTISRVTGYINDPSPALADAGVISPIPEIQTREMESILKVSSGQVAVMGGLMQDSVDNLKDAIPGLSKIPLIGSAFTYRNETSTKSELVIFLRPIVVKEASLDGDFKDYRNFLPNKDTLKDPENLLIESAKVGAARP